MAASYTVDQLTNLSMIEQRGGPFDDGVIMELRREALVSGLDATGTPDFRVLQEALNTLPAGTGVGFGDSPTGHPDLVLVERFVRLIPGEKTKCNVELVYKRQFTSVETLPLGVFIPRGGGGLRQITTHRDAEGFDVVVCYTYPDRLCNDPMPPPCGAPPLPACCMEVPAYPHGLDSLASQTVCMAGEIQVDLPSDTLEFEGRLLTPTPGGIVRDWRGSTNLNAWNGGAPGTWRCSEVSFFPWDIAQPGSETWVFNFLFQYDPTGWNPDAIFRNQLTGKPTIDLVDGNGVVEVNWYPPLNFEIYFPP